jgi:hypothetical protein
MLFGAYKKKYICKIMLGTFYLQRFEFQILNFANSGRRSFHIVWMSGCSTLLEQAECVVYVNNIDST